MSDDEIRRQEQIRLYAEALVRYYGFTGQEAMREFQDVKRRLDDGEPVDERMLGPIAKRADEADLRRTLSEHYPDDQVEKLIDVHRELRSDS